MRRLAETARREFDVVAVARTVAVHARQQYLARAEFAARGWPTRSASNLDIAPAAVRVNFPTLVRIVRIAPPRIDCDYNTLAAERLGARADQLGRLNRRRVERDLVGAGAQDSRECLRPFSARRRQ
jgi:hypothetical protein